ncbi:hypothetical protein [Rhizobium sp. L43]|uniref:hypothetical protein n=1 Tax=Rhizobium sp. L43 TaxID=2035452 RepID=UPI000BEA44CF|nr:hypothetical protein [Rhizobium sp. L43]PDS80139.1 hypothetical protein CO667_06480 [Rhizobium sp. L43]
MKALQIAVVVVGVALSKLCLDATDIRLITDAKAENDDTLILVNNIRQKDAEVFIKNVGTQRFKSLYLECTLRDSTGGRIDSVPVYVTNLDPGDSTTEEASTHKTRGIASVDCRIESIHRD